MTIVSHSQLRVSKRDWENPQAILNRLGGEVLDVLVEIIDNQKHESSRYVARRSLLYFDCMLRLIDEPQMRDVSIFCTSRFQDLQLMFYGSMCSKKFCNLSNTLIPNLMRAFYNLLLEVGKKHPISLSEYKPNSLMLAPTKYVKLFECQKLNQEEVNKLKSYFLTAKDGSEYNVLLYPMHVAMGEKFTSRFYNALKEIARPKAKDTALRDFGTTFSSFLKQRMDQGELIKPIDMMNPESVQIIITDFMEFHFTKMIRMKDSAQEGSLGSLQKLWSRYSRYWDKLVTKKVMAAPIAAFPVGNPKLIKSKGVRHRRVRRVDDGTCELVTHKLITPVPMHLTDGQATEMVFGQIRKDFDRVQSWLRSCLEIVWNNYQDGLNIILNARPINIENITSDYFDPKKNKQCMELALQYFKHYFCGYVDTSVHKTLTYPNLAARGGPNKRILSSLLGLPTREDAMAQIAYIASLDGRFSESALATAVLVDRKGRRINAVNTDSGITLSVMKERDSTDGWQHVVLNQESAQTVHRWLELTGPIRKYMMDNNIAGWQHLFIYLSRPLGKPATFTRTSNINSAFHQFALKYRDILGQIANTISISRIRSTRGVMKFLETMDIRSMARELGNSEETSMRHYLPDVLWEYFANNWLRIFQNLMIVEAVKDTPFLQRALSFKTVEELDSFLKAHAIKPLLPSVETFDLTLPRTHSYTDNAGKSCGSMSEQEVIISASREIFIILLSLKEAVQNAMESGKVVHDKALYWSEFAIHLERHISSQSFKDRKIKKMLSEASKCLASESFIKVICV